MESKKAELVDMEQIVVWREGMLVKGYKLAVYTEDLMHNLVTRVSETAHILERC